MFIAGWGKDNKKIAEAGIRRCDNCNNYTTWEIYKTSKKTTLYFIPIAKWKKKYFLVCTTCNASYELKKSKKDEFLENVVRIPDNNVCAKIWNKIDSNFCIFLKNNTIDENKNISNWSKAIITELKNKGYKEKDIKYVLNIYIRYLEEKNLDKSN